MNTIVRERGTGADLLYTRGGKCPPWILKNKVLGFKFMGLPPPEFKSGPPLILIHGP
jgi:hypothetical protein